jgi:hypothetical protein
MLQELITAELSKANTELQLIKEQAIINGDDNKFDQLELAVRIKTLREVSGLINEQHRHNQKVELALLRSGILPNLAR